MHFEAVFLLVLSVKLVQGDGFVDGEKTIAVTVGVVKKIANDNDSDKANMINNIRDNYTDSENSTILEEWKHWKYLMTDLFDLKDEDAKELIGGK